MTGKLVLGSSQLRQLEQLRLLAGPLAAARPAVACGRLDHGRGEDVVGLVGGEVGGLRVAVGRGALL